MQLGKLLILLLLLGGCAQLYSKDTLILAKPEFCGLRWQVLDILLRGKNETLVSGSEIEMDRVRLELTESKDKSTMSVIVTWPEGISCVIASSISVIKKNMGTEL